MGLAVKLKKRLNGFSLDVEWAIEKELTVLFGYSGAGKSLTLQMIAGLMEPAEGFVHSDEKVFFNSTMKINLPPQRRPFGYVFQNLALFPHMTVKENILYGAKGMAKDEKESRVRELIRSFSLEGLEDMFPSEISGGQKQRVAFARALMRRPDVLLLDEPFSALDNPLRIEMMDFLTDIRHEFSIPVILVTHDIFEVYTLADKIIVYSGGRIAQTGSPSEVFNKPASPDVEKLVNTRRAF